ncbi:MAG: hypothetical protein NT135_00015 [Candidatus Berkelbacteria bacterium]|nr:hypothetical protein [Candidatus Berkelbacteria bacterium]
MADINNYGKVIFDRDTSTAVSEILKKYNLNESPDEVFNKIEKEEILNGVAILTIVEEIVLGTAQKENLASLIEKKLKIPKQTAQELAIDVNEKLLLGARKATQEEIDALENEPEPTLESMLESTLESTEESQEELNPFVASPIKPLEPNLPFKPEITITENQTPLTQPYEKITNQPPDEKRKEDAYREPIE